MTSQVRCSLKMTTPNTNTRRSEFDSEIGSSSSGQDSTPAIPVSIPVCGAPGGTFYVQQAASASNVKPKIMCTQCMKEYNESDIHFSCVGCLVSLCAACVCSGYEQVHACEKYNQAEGKGIHKKNSPYFCHCTDSIKSHNNQCNVCLKRRIGLYNCFNCGDHKKATLICSGCFNHFICSQECDDMNATSAQAHWKICGKSLPIWCGHGRPILLADSGLLKCGCQMCEHARWSEDCYECEARTATNARSVGASGSAKARRQSKR